MNLFWEKKMAHGKFMKLSDKLINRCRLIKERAEMLSFLLIVALLFISPVNTSYAKDTTFDVCKKSLACLQDESEKLSPELYFLKNFFAIAHEKQYMYFSQGYQKKLLDNFKIKNAREYSEFKREVEPEFLVENSRIVGINKISKNLLRVVILVCWGQEEYDGIQTYDFSVSKENGKWEITNISN